MFASSCIPSTFQVEASIEKAVSILYTMWKNEWRSKLWVLLLGCCTRWARLSIEFPVVKSQKLKALGEPSLESSIALNLNKSVLENMDPRNHLPCRRQQQIAQCREGKFTVRQHCLGVWILSLEYMRSKRRERKRKTEINRSRMEQARGLRRRLDGGLCHINGKGGGDADF